MGCGVIDGGWRYAAASVIGTSHKISPEGLCQDSYSSQYCKNPGAFVAVVSDGAGSASHSQVGSRYTCDFIVRRIAASEPSIVFSHGFAADSLEILRHELFEQADALDLTIRDLACTLLVAVIAPGNASFWQIGDGAICFRESGAEAFECAFWPDKGEYANVTFFVTDVRAQEHLEFRETRARIDDLALLSDGLERLALDFGSRTAHTAFFQGLFPHIHSLSEGYSPDISANLASFLGSDRVNKRTDDDKTLILASRGT